MRKSLCLVGQLAGLVGGSTSNTRHQRATSSRRSDDWLKIVSAAGAATLTYAEAMWEVTRHWFRSLGAWVTRDGDEVKVQTHPLAKTQRELRDPGPFLIGT